MALSFGAITDKPAWCYHDICSYTRAVIWAAFIAFLVGGLISLIIGDSIAWVTACIVLGTYIEMGPGPCMLAGMIGLVVVLLILGVLAEWWDRWLDEPKVPRAIKPAFQS